MSTLTVTAQTPAAPDAATPYGGVTMAPGSIPSGASTPAPPSGGTPCPSPDPCVVTGQYDRHRDSANGLAFNLAGMTTTSSFNNFGLAYLYPVTHPQTGSGFNYEPVIAQPLYITHVNVPGAPSTMCGGIQYCNMLFVATLSDWVYAFDTGTPPTATGGNLLWSVNLATATGHCTSSGVPFINNHNGMPGVRNLPYYGIVATPAIDIYPSHPTAFVVSACVASSASTTINWYLDAIDLTTGTIVATPTSLADSGNSFPSNQIARASLLLTHPSSGPPIVYVTFGDGVREIGSNTPARCSPSPTRTLQTPSARLYPPTSTRPA